MIEPAGPDSPPAEVPLRPAQLDAEEGRPAYMPRLPWKWMGLAGGLLLALMVGYRLRQTQRTESLRSAILAAHRDELGTLAGRYLGFRRRVEALVLEAGTADTETLEDWADPQLSFPRLRQAEGLYLRLPAAQATSAEGILDAALTMEPDAIGRCLGVAALSARGLYQKGDFLTPAWRARVVNAQDLNPLRVLEDQLKRHVDVDVPVVFSMLELQWFMLVLERGQSRIGQPVDVYLWDLPRRMLLLRARIQGRGVLMPVRLAFGGAASAPSSASVPTHSPGANDCSIAAQLKALTGRRLLEVETPAGRVAAPR